MKFINKTAVITGAAGGIGTAITQRFLDEGTRVAAVDISTEALEKLASKMGNPENLLLAKTNISSEDSTQQLYQQIKDKWDSVDIIINNAGWFPFLEFEKMTYGDWRKVMDINLDGGFLVIKSLLPMLKQSTAGRIINTASGSFFDPPVGQAHYVAAKAGIIGLTRALAVELGDYNITVNAIAPGLTATPIVLQSFPGELIDKLAEHGAIKRRQTAEDLVGITTFLASEDASFITGQTISVDGGRSFI
ncbi:SDR family NAD(P)-dependent oxidoreductase [Agriterribacter sp.]|uniref:SDR family NAD(P)-dependent oxidoreductase n=1 Tax=Agriterribacter sp. TaxID=2821509 RepID=UPI002CBBDF40|nr:SDR family NAD(P)-dependent oxidoreductase [Agriterribacter sp.]HRP54389.1 SDR family NAD(P)-dependent oxidoreductase [Agriterribacter sp.]